VGVKELLNACTGIVVWIEELKRGASLGVGCAGQGFSLEGEVEKGQRGGTGFALIAVDEHGTGGGALPGGEGEEVVEGLELEERHGRIDDVEVEIVGLVEREVVQMVSREAAGVADGALVAGGFAGMDEGEKLRAGAAVGLVAEEELVVD
jgi:hypothetical protein